MLNHLDISIHGTQRVKIIERLVYLCRYSPGLIFLDAEPGVSPVNFIRDMRGILRDEMDFAILENDYTSLEEIYEQLASQ